METFDVKLIPTDDDEGLKFPAELANISETLKHIILEQPGSEISIPVQATFVSLTFIEQYYSHKSKQEQKPEDDDDSEDDIHTVKLKLSIWDKAFFDKIDANLLKQLILSVDNLQFEELKNKICLWIASMSTGKSCKEMKAVYQMENVLTNYNNSSSNNDKDIAFLYKYS